MVKKRVHNPVTHKYYAQQRRNGQRKRGQFIGLWHPPKKKGSE